MSYKPSQFEELITQALQGTGVSLSDTQLENLAKEFKSVGDMHIVERFESHGGEEAFKKTIRDLASRPIVGPAGPLPPVNAAEVVEEIQHSMRTGIFGADIEAVRAVDSAQATKLQNFRSQYSPFIKRTAEDVARLKTMDATHSALSELLQAVEGGQLEKADFNKLEKAFEEEISMLKKLKNSIPEVATELASAEDSLKQVKEFSSLLRNNTAPYGGASATKSAEAKKVIWDRAVSKLKDEVSKVDTRRTKTREKVYDVFHDKIRGALGDKFDAINFDKIGETVEGLSGYHLKDEISAIEGESKALFEGLGSRFKDKAKAVASESGKLADASKGLSEAGKLGFFGKNWKVLLGGAVAGAAAMALARGGNRSQESMAR